ncbi:hypothetical protein [Anaerococcus marasmi]|uniref:hypothetical protein n=1 Tax=Anaerococcus marasmi TaxID=2057797 RepID=UPI000CF9A5D3|nr:hypothetical protein [Anaerococcus marasmi]
MSIDYKKALELLKTEEPIYYDGHLKRKVTGIVWRRDIDALVPRLEVLDEETHSVSYVGLDKVDLAQDVKTINPDGTEVLKACHRMEDILDQIKTSIAYERGAGAAEGYVRIMREAIKLDKAICDFSIKESDKKVLETIKAGQDLTAEEISKEDADLAKRIEEFEEESL